MLIDPSQPPHPPEHWSNKVQRALDPGELAAACEAMASQIDSPRLRYAAEQMAASLRDLIPQASAECLDLSARPEIIGQELAAAIRASRHLEEFA